MSLEALEFVERRQVRVLVIQMHHEADRHEAVLQMIQKRAAAGGIIQRPAERMLHETGLVQRGVDLPKLFEAEPIFLRLASLRQSKARNGLLAQRSARALSQKREFTPQLHAARKALFVGAILGQPHVAGGDAAHVAVFVEQQFGCRKAGVDFHAQLLRLGAKKARDVCERADIIAVIAH